MYFPTGTANIIARTPGVLGILAIKLRAYAALAAAGRVTGRDTLTVLSMLMLAFVSPIWAADSDRARGNDKGRAGSNHARIGRIHVVVGRWCRQASILKVGDLVYLDDSIVYCGSPRNAADRLVIRFDAGGPNGKFGDREYECAAPGICDVPASLTLTPPSLKPSPEGVILISAPDLAGMLGNPGASSNCATASICSPSGPIDAALFEQLYQALIASEQIGSAAGFMEESFVVGASVNACVGTLTLVYQSVEPADPDRGGQPGGPCGSDATTASCGPSAVRALFEGGAAPGPADVQIQSARNPREVFVKISVRETRACSQSGPWVNGGMPIPAAIVTAH